MVLDAIANCVELLFTCIMIIAGAVMQSPVQVVLQGIESVNGSTVNMGCVIQVRNLTGNVTICGNFGSGGGVISYLVDSKSPAINTSTSDWASHLVTVRKNDATEHIPFEHVVLTFGFNTAVSLTSIELDLFLCPEWNIGAPFISVYGDNSNLVYSSFSSVLILKYTPNEISCDSLSTVTIFLQEVLFYHHWHILVTFVPQLHIEWVHVGEVRFLDTDTDSTPIPTSDSASVPVTPRK